MTIKHTHRSIPALSRDIGYSGPVNYLSPNPAAHGNICVIDTCRCGAIRKTNVNQLHIERGPWEPNSNKAGLWSPSDDEYPSDDACG